MHTYKHYVHYMASTHSNLSVLSGIIQHLSAKITLYKKKYVKKLYSHSIKIHVV